MPAVACAGQHHFYRRGESGVEIRGGEQQLSSPVRARRRRGNDAGRCGSIRPATSSSRVNARSFSPINFTITWTAGTQVRMAFPHLRHPQSGGDPGAPRHAPHARSGCARRLVEQILGEFLHPKGAAPDTLSISYHLSRLLLHLLECPELPEDRRDIHSSTACAM